jgi:hypothetical protein
MKGGVHRKSIADLQEWQEAELQILKVKIMAAWIKKYLRKQIMFKIALGKKVKDSITGFAGIVTGRVEYLTGCRQYVVASKSKGGKTGDAMWFDEDRLTGVNLAKTSPANNGGPQACEAPIK